jgi:hypothetical protein
MKTRKAIRVLKRRIGHLESRIKPEDTGHQYDLAELSALKLAVEMMEASL